MKKILNGFLITLILLFCSTLAYAQCGPNCNERTDWQDWTATLTELTVDSVTPPLVTYKPATSVCTSSCVYLTAPTSCEDSTDLICSNKVIEVLNAYIDSDSTNLENGDLLMHGSQIFGAAIDITDSEIILASWTDAAISWKLGFQSAIPQMAFTDVPKLMTIPGLNDILILVPAVNPISTDAGLYVAQFTVLGALVSENFYTYSGITSLTVNKAEASVIAGQATTLANSFGFFAQFPAIAPVGLSNMYLLTTTPGAAAGTCVDVEVALDYEGLTYVACTGEESSSNEAAHFVYFPTETGDLSFSDIKTYSFQINDVGPKPTKAEEIVEGTPGYVQQRAIWRPSKTAYPEAISAVPYDPSGTGSYPKKFALIHFNPEINSIDKAIRLDNIGDFTSNSKLLLSNLLDAEVLQNSLANIAPIENRVLFVGEDNTATYMQVFTYTLDNMVSGSSLPGYLLPNHKPVDTTGLFTLLSDASTGKASVFSIQPNSLPNLINLPDTTPSFIGIFNALWTGGHGATDFFTIEVLGETTVLGEQFLNLPTLNYSAGASSINPNGTILFQTERQIQIQTSSPDIEVLNFELKFQCLNGTFDTTTGLCDSCCEYDLDDGTCQAEVETFSAQFSTINVTMTLSAPSPINITALSLVCREFTASQWPANCSSLSPYGFGGSGFMTWANSSISTVIPTNAGVVINLTGNNIYPNITIPLGVAAMNVSSTQIGCEANGTWKIGDDQNFTINKTMTITAG